MLLGSILLALAWAALQGEITLVNLVVGYGLGYIIIALAEPEKFTTMVNAGEVPAEVVRKWPFYVRDSNKVCLAPAS